MAIWVVGDVQGCLADLDALLEKIRFDPSRDRLWLTGDLVNRGPDSLGVLRRVKGLGKAALTVLGNHDLHLLACRHVPHQKPKHKDTFGDVLAAPDCDELLEWLRHQPLLHHDASRGLTLVHAGLAPDWTLALAKACAAEAEAVLRGPEFRTFLAAMYGNLPARWDPALAGLDRLRFIVNCFTRIRFVSGDGALDLLAKGAPGSVPALLPWFAAPGRRSKRQRVVFGHWSTLRLTPSEEARHRVVPLDTGAIWGGTLTAWCPGTGERVEIPGSVTLPLDE